MAMSAHPTIPVVELGCLMGLGQQPLSSSQREVAGRLANALETFGLAYICLNDFEKNLVAKTTQDVIKASKDLFAVPDEIKAMTVGVEPGIARGYLARGSESGVPEAIELKEAFSYGYSGDVIKQQATKSMLAPSNIWPDACGAREPLENFFDFCGEVMQAVAKALTEVLNIEQCDAETISRGNTISLMRIWRYYPKNHQCETGSVKHTDWGFATLIAQDPDSDSALQTYFEGRWINVSPIENTFVINCGDYASVHSNGKLHSPVHRVRLTEKERYSLVYFQYPSFDSKVPTQNRLSPRLAHLSIFKNQSGDKSQELSDDDMNDASFGNLMLRKWSQVQRKK